MGEGNFPVLNQIQEIKGSWMVQFDPQWFYPTTGLSGDQAEGLLVFDNLEDWMKRPEPAVKNFSGKAVYRKVFELKQQVGNQKAEGSRSEADSQARLFLDLGSVKETARVRLNGKDLGVVWCQPWSVEITQAVKTGENTLEIEVVNLWPNRLVGDKELPLAERRTMTKMFVGGLNNDQLPSGLLGPVTIQALNQIKTK